PSPPNFPLDLRSNPFTPPGRPPPPPPPKGSGGRRAPPVPPVPPVPPTPPPSHNCDVWVWIHITPPLDAAMSGRHLLTSQPTMDYSDRRTLLSRSGFTFNAASCAQLAALVQTGFATQAPLLNATILVPFALDDCAPAHVVFRGTLLSARDGELLQGWLDGALGLQSWVRNVTGGERCSPLLSGYTVRSEVTGVDGTPSCMKGDATQQCARAPPLPPPRRPSRSRPPPQAPLPPAPGRPKAPRAPAPKRKPVQSDPPPPLPPSPSLPPPSQPSQPPPATPLPRPTPKPQPGQRRPNMFDPPPPPPRPPSPTPKPVPGSRKPMGFLPPPPPPPPTFVETHDCVNSNIQVPYVISNLTLTNTLDQRGAAAVAMCIRVSQQRCRASSFCCGMEFAKVEVPVAPACTGDLRRLTVNAKPRDFSWGRYDGGLVTIKFEGLLTTLPSPDGAKLCWVVRPGDCAKPQNFCLNGHCQVNYYSTNNKCCPATLVA
ncbi:hypothetical protein TSOC_010595, partial [Tetrabaena socialis]